MCTKTKCKSKGGSKRKGKCAECMARKIATEGSNQMYLAPGGMPVTYQYQPVYDYGYSYGYGDWSTWEDNYPAVISNKRWKDHTQTTQNAYESARENGKEIGEAKNAITGEIKEAQKAIDLAHANIKGMHVAVKEAHLAIQDAISDKHAEHMSKQEEYAADIAKVRQLMEEEARQREEARRLQELVRYAQSQGLLQTPTRDRDHRSRSSRSSSPATSMSSNGTRGNGRTRVDEESVAEKQRQWDRERQQLEQQCTEATRETADTRQQLQQERERWSQTEKELEYLRRRDAYFHHPRFQGPYYDDGVEGPAYSAYPYADYGTGGGGGGHRGSRGLPPRCGNARPWDY